MDDGGRNQAEAGAGALGLRGGGVGGVPEGDHCLLLHPHPHHCQLLGRLLLYKGQRGEINFNSVVVAYFCTFHTSHFSIDYTMIITVCQHVCYLLYVNMQCEYVNMQHTLLTCKKSVL